VEKKGRGKAKEQCENSENAKEDKEIVLPGKQCENLENVNENRENVLPGKLGEQYENLENVNEDKESVNEEKESVWQNLEKEAADAVARAAVAVSDLVADRLPVEETILIIGKASEAVLGENNEHVSQNGGSAFDSSISTLFPENFQHWLNPWVRNPRRQRECREGFGACTSCPCCLLQRSPVRHQSILR